MELDTNLIDCSNRLSIVLQNHNLILTSCNTYGTVLWYNLKGLLFFAGKSISTTDNQKR